MNEPEIVIHSREELAEVLTEAVEVEHNLMCCYLYAAWSLKQADELPAEQAELVESWRQAIVGVAIDEMAHFANANNLLSAIGSHAHMGRPNFPVSPGYHPADVVVHLRRFDAGTIDHFVFLERPEGVELADGEGFDHTLRYERAAHDRLLMPTAQDYATVGHLYRAVQAGLRHLSQALGEEALFVGDPARQIRPDHVDLDGLVAVTDLASALDAVEQIVQQGEGSADDVEGSHYRRFCDVRDAFAAHRAADPGFDPARVVPENPVQRKPPVEGDRVWIGHPTSAALLDLCNALYNHMLRLLGSAYTDVPDPVRARLIGEGIGLMRVLVPLNEVLTRQPAQEGSELRAGMSFAVTREIRVPQGQAVGLYAQRTRELAEGARRLQGLDPALVDAAERLESMAARLGKLDLGPAPTMPSAPPPAAPAREVHTPQGDDYVVVDGVEHVRGKELTIHFDGHRCIHARHCVLGAPEVFRANVEGPWIAPDAMDTEALVAVAERCPSGAITYTRRTDRPAEGPPLVNRLNVRQNGPLAVHADLQIDGEAPRFRAVLCRCGKSQNKPFCDNSHKEAGFEATGEPPAADEIVALEVRNGPLHIQPTVDGPLLVRGNLELCTGTGATFAKKTKCALCRCGGSKNKPFCDGTHRTNGFRSS